MTTNNNTASLLSCSLLVWSLFVFFAHDADGFIHSVGRGSLPQQKYAAGAVTTTGVLPSLVSSSNGVVSSASSSALALASDFGSAMPEKPEQSLEEKLQQSAYDFIATMENALSDTPEIAPPELALLKAARKNPNSTVADLTKLVYELMIERAMLYDEDTDTGALTLTQFTDLPNNLDIPEVKQEFAFLYTYGMNLLKREMLDSDTVKAIVVTRLIKRTGLTPEEFDTWLGY